MSTTYDHYSLVDSVLASWNFRYYSLKFGIAGHPVGKRKDVYGESRTRAEGKGWQLKLLGSTAQDRRPAGIAKISLISRRGMPGQRYR